MVDVNYIAIFLGAIANMVVGMVWYGPLFGKPWMEMMGFNKKDMEKAKPNMGKTYLIAFISALVMSSVMAYIVDYAQAKDAVSGAQAGFWVWLGFLATSQLGMVLWEGKPWKLYGIYVAYYLVSLIIMGIVHAVLV